MGRATRALERRRVGGLLAMWRMLLKQVLSAGAQDGHVPGSANVLGDRGVTAGAKNGARIQLLCAPSKSHVFLNI